MRRTTTRRDFLKLCGLGTCAFLAAITANGKTRGSAFPASRSATPHPGTNPAVVVDGWLLRESDL